MTYLNTDTQAHTERTVWDTRSCDAGVHEWDKRGEEGGHTYLEKNRRAHEDSSEVIIM